MYQVRAALAPLAMILTGLVPSLVSAQSAAPSELSQYVASPDAVYAWTLEGNNTTDFGKIYEIRLTSQQWRGTTWTHQLKVYEPVGLEADRMKHVLLFITGGSNTDSKSGPGDHAQAFAIAKACNARVAVLPQVPNQPLLDGKKEDDLISYTFLEYMKTREADLPLLFPMVKSAVRAMDAIQDWAQKENKPVEGFIVTGASKRGWTTWLTGATDPRVRAIAPMVIPTLNMKVQSKHQLDSWGKYSEQIQDYTRRGLTELFDDPLGVHLWRMVDPYSYLERIRIPILQVNGTNDRYWTVDSVRVFWDAIRGTSSHVTYLPNAGHGLEKNREWAFQTIGALFRHVVAGVPMPRFEWSYTDKDQRPTVTLSGLQPAPRQVSLWVVRSTDRDFREDEWKKVEGRDGAGGSHSLQLDRPAGEFVAMYADLEYEFEGTPFHLCTPIAVFGENGEIKPQP